MTMLDLFSRKGVNISYLDRYHEHAHMSNSCCALDRRFEKVEDSTIRIDRLITSIMHFDLRGRSPFITGYPWTNSESLLSDMLVSFRRYLTATVFEWAAAVQLPTRLTQRSDAVLSSLVDRYPEYVTE